jgi:hypothetical protein
LLTAAESLGRGFAPRVSGYALARGCTEASAIAAWLLDEAISEQQRCARGFAERIVALQAQERVKSEPTHFSARIAKIRAAAATAGVSVTDSRAGIPYKFDNEIWPSATEAIDDQSSSTHVEPSHITTLVFRVSIRFHA